MGIPNVTVDLLNATMHLRQTTCVARYTFATSAGPGGPLPNEADTYSDGSIWASVFCPTPTNLETQFAGKDGCSAFATFALQGCTTQ
jgi:hypothetical protein